jgi:anti-anti-sigma factor
MATSVDLRHAEYRPKRYATIVGINGPVDASGERVLRSCLESLTRAGARHVVLDCTHVPYINSTGLGTILLYTDKLECAGGALILAHLSDRALKIIELLGFAPALDFVDSEEIAMKIISGMTAGRSEQPV